MGAGNVVDAAEVPKDVSVTLHKRAFEDEFPEGYPKLNTGEIITDFGGTALPDVEFTVYDVTAKYHELASATGGTSQGAVNTIVADSTTSKPTYAASIVDGENTDTKGTTSATGEVKFGNLPLKKMVGGISKDAVYLFLETGAPANVKQYAQPIVLAMPIYTVATDGNPSVLNTDIHLYPKNVTMEDTKEITKIDSVTANYGDGETVNLEFGQTIEYQITINMPSHLAQLDSFTVTDIPADGLLLDMESITLSGDLSTDAPADYTLSKSGNGFKIDFNLNSTKVLALAGKQVTITYEMELTNEIAIDETAGNEVFVTINSDNEISFNGPEVSTGGYRFEKTDAHTGAGLAGAKFKVQRSATEFAKFTVGTNGWYEFDGYH